MLVGVHTDPSRGLLSSVERYEKILEFNGIPYTRLDAGQADFWERVSGLSHFVFEWYGTNRQRDLARTILPIIEHHMGIPCYPDTNTCWPYDDKVREYYLLEHIKAPVVPTWVFWNEQSALTWLQDAHFPLVFKLWAGAGSENVLLIHSLSHAERLVKKMFGPGARSGHLPLFGSLRWREMVTKERLHRLAGKVRRFLRGEEIAPFEQSHRDYVLFQRFLEGNEFDTRVYVNGDRAFGYRRHVRKNDFRASGSGALDWNPDFLDIECIQISFDISRRLGFQSMAYDFLFDEKHRPCISEISYTLADWGIWRCPGYWDLALKWHEGHYWPQYLTLRNILKLADLKQPEMPLPPGHFAMR